MTTVFDEWNLEDARAAIAASAGNVKDVASYRKFVDGDHWQDWDGWIGPKPDIAGDADALRMLQEVERGFVSRNAIGECVGRHVNGVLARNVKWTVGPRREMADGDQPTAEEKALAEEATQLLKAWVEARKLNQEYDKLAKELLIASFAHQRMFIPPGEVDGNGVVPNADLATSIGKVYVHFPLAGEAAIYTDPRTQQKCSVYLYRETTNSRPSQAQAAQGEERAELTYLDGDNTVIRIIGSNGESGGEPYSYGLGRRLLMSQLEREALVTKPAISLQKLLNLSKTMKQRNVILGGFLERVAINAQLDGVFEEVNGQRKFVPSSMPVGAGTLTTLTGYAIDDGDGKQTLVTPNMLWRDPVSVETFLDTEKSTYEDILAECNQLHYAMAGDATASGVSREQAQAAYLIDLLQTKQQIDLAWSWLLETALAMAAVLSNQADRYDELRVSAEASVDPGPISADVMRVAMELAGGQPLLSVKTAQGWVGVEDVDGEQAQIAKEQEAQAQMLDAAGLLQELDRVRGGGNPNGNPSGDRAQE